MIVVHVEYWLCLVSDAGWTVLDRSTSLVLAGSTQFLDSSSNNFSKRPKRVVGIHLYSGGPLNVHNRHLRWIWNGLSRRLQRSGKAHGLKALLGKSMGSIPGGVSGLFPKQKSRFLGVRGLLGLDWLASAWSSGIRGSHPHPESRLLTGQGQSGRSGRIEIWTDQIEILD